MAIKCVLQNQFNQKSLEELEGILPVENGGTGKDTLTASSYLVGNGTNAVVEKTPAEVKQQLDTYGYANCATASTTVAKVATIGDGTANSFKLVQGVRILVKFDNVHTVNGMTLNINNTGAKTVLQSNSDAIKSNEIRGGTVYEFVYDGTNYRMIGSVAYGSGFHGVLPIGNGGTGLTSAPSMLVNLASTGAASPLQASPRPGVTGVLPVANGGTGATTLASGYALIGNGTSTVSTRGITNNTATSSGIAANTTLVTMNTLRYAINRTTSVAAADTSYTTYMARGQALSSSALTPTVNGTIAWQYE